MAGNRYDQIMEEIRKMNVNGIGAGYPAAEKAKVRQAQLISRFRAIRARKCPFPI